MKKGRIAIFILSLTVAFTMSPVVSVSAADNAAAASAPDHDGYIVMFKDDASNSTIKNVVKQEGDSCESIDTLATQDQKMAVVSAKDTSNGGSATPKQIENGYEDHGCVVGVSPNYIRKSLSTSIRPLSSLSLNDTFFSELYQFNLMDVSDAWSNLSSNNMPSSKVKIAVIDTGVNMSHKDLLANVDSDLSTGFVNGDTVSGKDVDFDTHGTHVTGIIGATANNSEGITGTASGTSNNIVDIIPIRVFSEDGAYDSDIVTAIEYAVKKNVKVINLSLGGEDDDSILDDAIDSAYSSGVTVVCAAGNIDDEIGNAVEYPAASDHTISVAACDSSGSRTSYSTYNDYVDVMAPGDEIYSTVGISASRYGYMSGTSMATPMVSAEAALLYAADPDITPSQVLSDITKTCSHYSSGKNKYTGYGLVNYGKALDLVLENNDTAAAVSVSNMTNVSAKAIGSLKAKITWSKKTDVSGYQIAKKRAGHSYTYTKVSSSSSSKTFTKLAKKKYYYFKIRAYKISNGKTYYGSWSTAKKVLIRQ